MPKVVRARILAPVVHCSLFTMVSVLHWMWGQPAFKQFKGSADLLALVLWVADIPISIISSLFWLSSTVSLRGTAWAWVFLGLFGTIWWYFLGLSIEAWIRRLLGRRGLNRT
jgi:hypothetical protein